MKMDTAATLQPETNRTPDEVYQQIGTLTRMLHDTLKQMGVMPKLQEATDGLPDVRSRLHYIADKTAQAAEKVLNSVDLAKEEQAAVRAATQAMARAMAADPTSALAQGEVLKFSQAMDARMDAIDGHLTDIMMAQDFHDLTGQVVARVVTMATDLEDSLLKLLVQVLPAEQRAKVVPATLHGPLVNPEGQKDVVANQSEVDDLLASLGF